MKNIRRMLRMPKNNKLKPKEFPQIIRFGESPTTRYKNNLDSIKVRLISSPSFEELKSYLPPFVKATWMENTLSCEFMPDNERERLVRRAFTFKTLPTALETIGLVWEIDGISLQEVTHILRYRNASFSADCSADKWWTHKDALVPNSIQNSNGKFGDDTPFNLPYDAIDRDNFHMRYKKLVEMSKELYCDMIDSKEVSILDARMILPRCLETFYYMRMNLKDTLAFIQQRIDKQIQPETDNLIAYMMYLEILKRYPVANGLVDIHAPARHYISQARSNESSNIYAPDIDSDVFEWNENDFLYGERRRDELNGTDEGACNYFNDVLHDVEAAIENEESHNRAILGYDPVQFDKEA